MKKNYTTAYYIRFLVWLFLSVFVRFFRIKKTIPTEVKQIKEPYLLLSNHVGFWDPFIVGHFLPKFTHFVASDAAFISLVNRFFLTRLGVIPKKKNRRDAQVIRAIMEVVQRGGSVGLFPEAVRNWSGNSFPIDPSIIKLIKKLNIPVIVGMMQGMNLFNPRWSKKLRQTQVHINYSVLFTEEDINELSDEQMFERLCTSMHHDEVAYQRKHMNIIYSNHKAEQIGYALYVCPHCEAIDSFNAQGNNFECNGCGYKLLINQFGFYELVEGDKLYFDNIRDWYNWQEQWMLKHVSERVDESYSGVIFEDMHSLIYHGEDNRKLKFLGEGSVRLYIDRIEISLLNGQLLKFNFHDLNTINPQLHERLEIVYKNQEYRIVSKQEGISGLKWEVATNAIWQKSSNKSKLSPYISCL